MTNEPPPVAGEPHPEAWAAFQARAGDGPVVMLNLFQLQPGSDDAFAEWMTTATPLLAAHDAEVIYAGSTAELLVGDVGGSWDRMILIRYPTRQAMLELAADPAFLAAVPQRDAIVASQVLYATDPSEA